MFFCDASFDGYGACVYLKSELDVGLVASRTRVAPLSKKESIGRLELAACVEGVEIGFRVAQALHLDIRDVHFYTDSTNALLWMKTHKKISIFAASRVCKIKDRTKIEQWKHISTEQNPADILSRGMMPKKLSQCDLWWKGPEFIRLGTEPMQPVLLETEESRKEMVEESRIMMQRQFPTSKDLFANRLFLKYESFSKFLQVYSKVAFCAALWRSKNRKEFRLQEANWRNGVKRDLHDEYVKECKLNAWET